MRGVNDMVICLFPTTLFPGCTSNSDCSFHEPTCDTLTRICYNCNHYCNYYHCNGSGKRWMHKKCRDHSQMCLQNGLRVDRAKAGLKKLNVKHLKKGKRYSFFFWYQIKTYYFERFFSWSPRTKALWTVHNVHTTRKMC